jgi:hypothetical protein
VSEPLNAPNIAVHASSEKVGSKQRLLNSYSLGSSNELKRNAGGSLTLYLQHNSPGADKEAKWLPAPAGPFYLTLRNYPPTPAVAEGLKDPASFEGPPPVMPAG